MLRNVKVYARTRGQTEREVKNTMVKIKVSYEHDYELHKLKIRLAPMIKFVKVPKEQKGRFKKAYIVLENVHEM